MIKSIKEIRDELKYVSSPELIDSILKEWADSIVDEILSDPSLIYYDGAEAVYSYEAFEKFKQSVK